MIYQTCNEALGTACKECIFAFYDKGQGHTGYRISLSPACSDQTRMQYVLSGYCPGYQPKTEKEEST